MPALITVKYVTNTTSKGVWVTNTGLFNQTDLYKNFSTGKCTTKIENWYLPSLIQKSLSKILESHPFLKLKRISNIENTKT